MAGAGTSSAGLSPFGVGTPNAATVPPEDTSGNAVFINAASGDYEIDSNTRELKRMPTTRQQVLLAVNESYGSSTVRPNDGLGSPKKIDQHFEQRQRNALVRALDRLTRTGRIRIDDVQVSTEGQRVEDSVLFTDLTADPNEDKSPDDGV